MYRSLFIKSLLLSLLVLSGCEEERITYDGPTLVHFPVPSQSVMLDWNDQGQVSIPVEVVTTSQLSSAATFQVTVDNEGSTAVADKHVIVPATFSFPANTYTGSFNVMVNMQDVITEFEEEGGGTLQLQLILEGENAAMFNNTVQISLVLPYPISVPFMIGRWAVTDEGYGSESVPVTDSYTIEVFANPDDDNSVIVEGLWEIPGIPLVMHLDMEAWRVTIASQHYGCYNAGLSEPACVNIYAHDFLFNGAENPDVTGIITPEGEVRLTSGYAMLIEDHPTHSGYFFIPRVHTSTWVKMNLKDGQPEQNRTARSTFELER